MPLHKRTEQMNQYLKSAVPMQLNGGMVHDVVSCQCLYHASHTLMQYSVSFCVAFGVEFVLVVVICSSVRGVANLWECESVLVLVCACRKWVGLL